MTELERELRKLISAEAASQMWQSKIAEIEATIADALAYPTMKYLQCSEVRAQIRERLEKDAVAHYENTEEKVQETPVGKVVLKVTQDFIIDDEEILRDFVKSKDMEKKLLKISFDKTRLKTWCSAMAKVGVEIDGARFGEKYVLNIIWPKEAK